MTAGLPSLARRTPAPKPGIVHLGLGAFFRSHGAIVIEDATRAVGGDWGIVGVSLRSAGMRDALAPQDFTYTAVEMSKDGENQRHINVLSNVLFAPEASGELLDLMADPAIKIVSLTVTEKGYCHVPSSGQLDLDHPDISADLASETPQSSVGYLVRALARRRASGGRPFTVLSCDNLPENGRVTRNVVVGLAEAIDPDLAVWISAEGCFPSTMVDRIVPATTPENVERLARETSVLDRAPVFHEPFCHWVIEDSFVDDVRPAFDQSAGAQLVEDVAPFELMKIRMLNGTHSTLAYLGYLAGYETISQTMGDNAFRAFVQRVWAEEIIPTLSPPDGVDLSRYAKDLLHRYENPAIQHRTWQIAMDGSQKLPQRILGTLADNLVAGRPSGGLMLGVAAWMRYVGGVDENGASIDVKDPMASRLRALSDQVGTPREKAINLLSVEEVFGGVDLPMVGRDGIAAAYETLVDSGARAAVAKFEI